LDRLFGPISTDEAKFAKADMFVVRRPKKREDRLLSLSRESAIRCAELVFSYLSAHDVDEEPPDGLL
jgi:hypothetical protein